MCFDDFVDLQKDFEHVSGACFDDFVDLQKAFLSCFVCRLTNIHFGDIILFLIITDIQFG